MIIGLILALIALSLFIIGRTAGDGSVCKITDFISLALVVAAIIFVVLSLFSITHVA